MRKKPKHKANCIFGPNGVAILDSIGLSRKQCRRRFAEAQGVTWGFLWELGYRLHRVPHSYKKREYEYSAHPINHFVTADKPGSDFVGSGSFAAKKLCIRS